jgi:hypothetical protein
VNRLFFCLTLLIFSCCSQAKNTLITNITESAEYWTVQYQSHTPIKSIEFAISPDNSRTENWTFKDPIFRFIQSGSKEIIIRKDNASFTSVELFIFPKYIPLPKYYAPFSPYSDNGMLFHSARFFACAQLCSPTENSWYLTLTVNSDKHIYFKGEKYSSSVQWWDYDDGTKVYVGNLALDKQSAYISVIDNGLPQSIQAALKAFIPAMVSLLEQRYGTLKDKPMLFASFGKNEGSHYGRQGGVLPSQVFMHWYGKMPVETAQQRFETVWFFAHEVAHLYQGQIKGGITKEFSWIHEGHAEFIAMHLVKALTTDYEQKIQDKLKADKFSCKKALNDQSLSSLRGNYQLHYQCGLVIYQKLFEDMKQVSGIDKFWQTFEKHSHTSQFNTKQSFLSIAKASLSDKSFKEIEALIK